MALSTTERDYKINTLMINRCIMNEITADTVNKYLSYNPETGDFIWLPRTKGSRFNKKLIGKIAGYKTTSKKSKTSYYSIKLKGKDYKAHRLAMLVMDGYMPEEVDHIDGNGLNNKYSNLRMSNRFDNSRNPQIQSSNKTGVIGVNWHKAAKKWQARAVDNYGNRVDLGRYDSFDAAVAVRRRYEKEFKYFEYRD